MVANPNKDTEPHVQQLFVGSYRETGMWSQDLAGVGFSVSTPCASSLLASVFYWITYIFMTIKNKMLAVFATSLLVPAHFTLAISLMPNPYYPIGTQSNPINVQSSGDYGVPLMSNPYAPIGSEANPIYIQDTRSLSSTRSGSSNPTGYRCVYDYSAYSSARDRAYQKITAEISVMEGSGMDKSWLNTLYMDKGRVSQNYISYLSDCYRIDQVFKTYNETPTVSPATITSTVSGCTSTVGFSPTTGKSCSGLLTSVTSNKTELCPYIGKGITFFPSPPPMNDPSWVAPPTCTCSAGYEADKSGQACIIKVDTSSALGGNGSSPVIESSTSSFSNTLRSGTSGDEVRLLQTVLIKLGHMQGSATGYFGPITKAALSAYQLQNGLEAVGMTGPKTRALLNKESE